MKFALTLKDLEEVFNKFDFEYVLFGHTNSNTPIKYRCLGEIPGLLVSKTGDPHTDEKYILTKCTTSYQGRRINRDDGSTVWAWDNLTIDGPVVSFGGKYQDQYIIGSVDAANHLTENTKKLLKKLNYRICKNTVSVKGVRISKDLYEAKTALSFSIGMSPYFDFMY